MSTQWSAADGLLKIKCPDAFEVGDEAPVRRTRAPGGPTATTPADHVVAALAQQGFERVHAPLEFGPKVGQATRSAAGKADLRVEVSEDEDAVILLEQDGVFSWQMPVKRTPVRAPAKRRRSPTEAMPKGRREITFKLNLVGDGPPVWQRRRGIVALAGKFKAHVFKFLAGRIAGLAVRHLERHVEPGLVVIRSTDPRTWRRVNALAEAGLPEGRAARVLLLVHGTFSSTVGCFGTLGRFQWSKEFLQAALREYDAVLGYDHRTLSVDPAANASDLLEALTTSAQAAIDADVICHSRGALVTRSLVEHLLPQHASRSRRGLRRVERVVFVGGANGGTKLADPENWHALIDVYTNLAVAATATADLLPGPHVAAVAGGMIRGLGAFAKYLASYAAGEQNGVPGLAAMCPDGPFVRELNNTQPGQPEPANAPWYVVTSDFEPSLALGGDGAKQLPKKLLLMLADGVMDKLIGTSNDLVVNTDSMSAIDPAVGGFVKDGFHFGRNGYAYHTVYFSRPEVATALTEWLCTGQASVEPVGAVVEPAVPIAADQNIVIVEGDMPAASVRSTISDAEPDYVLMPHRGAMYAFTPEEIGPQLSKVKSRALQEAVRSRVDWQRDFKSRVWNIAYQRGGGPAVVYRQGEPVAVVPPPKPRPLEELIREQESGKKPKERKKTSRSAKVTAHFRAGMASEVAVGEQATVQCTIARAALPPPTAGVSADGVTDVHESEPILVQVIAKANAKVVGEDRAEIRLPDGRETRDLYFDIEPTHEGPGEIWVIARQGPAPLVTLKLTPTFTAGQATQPDEQMSAEATIATGAQHNCVRQSLRITEIRRGDETYFQYELEAGDLGVLQNFLSAPLVGDRDEYVRRLYKRIEASWTDSNEDSEKFGKYLQAVGGVLFDELFPAELRTLLWAKRNELRNMWVLSTEPFIPWELVHLKNGKTLDRSRTWFLGEFGMVRWLHGRYPSETVRCRQKKVRYIVPDYPGELALPETTAEAQFLRTTFGAREVPANHKAVLELLGKSGSFDLLHFAGHGAANQDSIEDASIMLAGSVDGMHRYVPDLLDATTVSGFARLDNKNGRPMVVLNACQTGRLGTQLTGLGGFAKAFLDSGAGVFVSSLWQVGDSSAKAFALTLYEKLLQGKTLAEASALARMAARNSDDTTWLAYVVYGNPCAKLIR